MVSHPPVVGLAAETHEHLYKGGSRRTLAGHPFAWTDGNTGPSLPFVTPPSPGAEPVADYPAHLFKGGSCRTLAGCPNFVATADTPAQAASSPLYDSADTQTNLGLPCLPPCLSKGGSCRTLAGSGETPVSPPFLSPAANDFQPPARHGLLKGGSCRTLAAPAAPLSNADFIFCDPDCTVAPSLGAVVPPAERQILRDVTNIRECHSKPQEDLCPALAGPSATKARPGEFSAPAHFSTRVSKGHTSPLSSPEGCPSGNDNSDTDGPRPDADLCRIRAKDQGCPPADARCPEPNPELLSPSAVPFLTARRRPKAKAVVHTRLYASPFEPEELPRGSYCPGPLPPHHQPTEAVAVAEAVDEEGEHPYSAFDSVTQHRILQS